MHLYMKAFTLGYFQNAVTNLRKQIISDPLYKAMSYIGFIKYLSEYLIIASLMLG